MGNRLRLAALASFLVATQSSCVAAFGLDEAVARKLCEDQARLKGYDGAIVERGVLEDPDAAVAVVSRVLYRAPGELKVVVESPEAFKGDTFAYVGSTVHVFSRAKNAGVRIRGLPVASVPRRETFVKESVKWDLEHYGYREGAERETVAGRSAIAWTVTPREPSDLHTPSRWWLDADVALPLKVELDRADGKGALYSMAFRELRVNGDAPDVSFAAPESASWLDWDLDSEKLSRDQAKALADFPLLEAPEDPKGFKLARCLRASTRVVPHVALVYERGAFWASVAETKDRGFLDPTGRGVRVDVGDGERARVTFFGTTSILEGVRKGVQLTIMTNLPFPELVRLARGLAAR